jgi:carboxypeptidase family protein
MRRRLPCSRNTILYELAVLFVGLFLFSNVASAQQAATGITGQVKDTSGGILPGVTVTGTSPALQVPSVTDVTNAQGEYRLTPLPIGTYTVEFSLPGFQTNRQTGFQLDVGVQARLDVALKVGTIAETVTVSGLAPIVDVASTAASTQFTPDTLSLTPTSRNGLISLGAQAPGVRGLTDVGGGTVGLPVEFQTFGQQTESGNTIEGVVTSVNQYGGGNGGNYFDYDSFEEVRVQSLSNGPEVASHGAAFTMIVKSGGNAFHGHGQFGYMSHRLESTNIDAGLRTAGITAGNPLNLRTDSGGDLGGRIIRDKLWFYVSERYRQEARQDLGGAKPDGSPVVGVDHELTFNQKVSYQMTPSNRFIFFNFGGHKYVYAQNVSQFVAYETRNWRFLPLKTTKAEWQATRKSLVMSAQWGYWWWADRDPVAVTTTSSALKAMGIPYGRSCAFASTEVGLANYRPATMDLVTQKTAGTLTGQPTCPDNGKYDDKFTLSAYRPDLFLGNHEFKAGVGWEPYWRLASNGDREQAGANAGNYQLIYSNGVPSQVSFTNGPVTTKANLNYTNAYANDTWTIARRVTLNLGVRYARDNAFYGSECRLAGPYPFDAAMCHGKIQDTIFSTFAPRLYFSYDVTGDARTVIKGGWGRFDRQRSNGEFNYLNPIQSTTYTYRWHNPNNLPFNAFDPSQINLDPNGPDFLGPAPLTGNFSAPRTGTVNPNEKRGGTDQLSITLERQLAKNLGVRLTGVYIRTFDEPRYLNTLRPPSAYTIPVTRPIPGPDNVVGPNPQFITYYEYPAALAGAAYESFIMTNDPAAGEHHKAVDLQLSKRLGNRWQLLAGYTATKNDVPLPRYDDGFFISSNNNARGISNWTPNAGINTSTHAWDRLGKVSGIYMLPAAVSVSVNYNYQSGLPQARQALFGGGTTIPTIVLNVEPIGSIRTPALKALDLRLDKAFTLGRGQKMALRGNLYNVLNANTVTARNLRSGPTYLQPTAILPPRIAELGVTYTF